MSRLDELEAMVNGDAPLARRADAERIVDAIPALTAVARAAKNVLGVGCLDPSESGAACGECVMCRLADALARLEAA